MPVSQSSGASTMPFPQTAAAPPEPLEDEVAPPVPLEEEVALEDELALDDELVLDDELAPPPDPPVPPAPPVATWPPSPQLGATASAIAPNKAHDFQASMSASPRHEGNAVSSVA
jgi:hypothetical protein